MSVCVWMWWWCLCTIVYSVGWVKCNSKQRIKFQTYTNSTFLIFIRPYLSLFHHSYPILIILVFLLLIFLFMLFRPLSCCNLSSTLLFSFLSFFSLLLDYLSFTLPPPSFPFTVLLLILILSPKSLFYLLNLDPISFTLLLSPSTFFSLLLSSFSFSSLSFILISLHLLVSFSLILLISPLPFFYLSYLSFSSVLLFKNHSAPL